MKLWPHQSLTSISSSGLNGEPWGYEAATLPALPLYRTFKCQSKLFVKQVIFLYKSSSSSFLLKNVLFKRAFTRIGMLPGQLKVNPEVLQTPQNHRKVRICYWYRGQILMARILIKLFFLLKQTNSHSLETALSECAYLV